LAQIWASAVFTFQDDGPGTERVSASRRYCSGFGESDWGQGVRVTAVGTIRRWSYYRPSTVLIPWWQWQLPFSRGRGPGDGSVAGPEHRARHTEQTANPVAAWSRGTARDQEDAIQGGQPATAGKTFHLVRRKEGHDKTAPFSKAIKSTADPERLRDVTRARRSTKLVVHRIQIGRSSYWCDLGAGSRTNVHSTAPPLRVRGFAQPGATT
jgi:hypothetical protein